MTAAGFAVIELATTGVFPHAHDRLVEVAVVHLDARGCVEGRWDTAIAVEAPGRSRMAGDAPTLREAAPRLVGLLANRVLVAHGAAFGIRFLLAELQRVTPWVAPEPVVLCTMQLARELVPAAARSLGSCCDALGVSGDRCGTVRGRAAAAARVLAALMVVCPADRRWSECLEEASGCEWPELGSSGEWMPHTEAQAESMGFGVLQSTSRPARHLEVQLPARDVPANSVDYLALLDRCLAVGCAPSIDPSALAAYAAQFGLDDDEWRLLHRAWFDDLARSTIESGGTSPIAQHELLDVARMLALSTAEALSMLRASAAA